MVSFTTQTWDVSPFCNNTNPVYRMLLMINTMAPNVGVQIGDDKVSNCLFVDDLTLITENAHDLQCAINIVD